jgi:starvation-inducible DNA-binding protein
LWYKLSRPAHEPSLPSYDDLCQDAHEIVLKQARSMARRAAEAGDDGKNALIVSDVIRTNELQVWFVAEHVVEMPLATAD